MVEARARQPGPRARESFAAMCEVAQRFAGWLGLGPSIEAALEFVFARWDGQGFPRASAAKSSRSRCACSTSRGTSRSSSPPRGPTRRARCSSVASGEAYEPRLVELALQNFDELLAELDETRMWEHALESEPFPQIWLAGDADRCRLRRDRRADRPQVALAARALDRRRRPRRGGRLAAELAGGRRRAPAASRARARPRPRRRVERDLGEARPARLRRVGARSPASALHRARVRAVAGARADRASWPAPITSGSTAPGTTAACAAPALDRRRAILAAADCYSAMREARPHRPALEPEAAEAELMREATEGRLDRDAVDAVLAAAGHRVAEAARASSRPA